MKRARQQGFVLIIGLIMLVLLTLMAISAINSTTTSLQIVGNQQFRNEAISAAQKAINTVISNRDFLTTPPADQAIDVNGDGVPDFTVTFTPAPSCTYFKPVAVGDTGVPKDCISSIGTLCYWTYWDITANVEDAMTKAQVTLHQGVRTIAGINSALAFCGV